MRSVLRLYLYCAAILALGCSIPLQEAQAQYCYPNYSEWGYACNQPYGASFTSVQVNSITNTSGCSGYTDYSGSVLFRMFAGVQSTITVKGKTFGSWPYGGEAYVNIWIDYNRNNSFDANEQLNPSGAGFAPDGSEGTRTITATAAANLTPGVYKARFKCVGPPEGNSNQPCYNYYGEVEDYNIEIFPPLPDPSPIAVSVVNPGDNSPVALPVAPGTYNVGFTLANLAAVNLVSCTYTYTVTNVQTGVPLAGANNVTKPEGPLGPLGTKDIALVNNLPVLNPLAPYRIQVSVANAVGQFANGDNNNTNNSLDAFVGPALNGGEYYIGGTPTPTNWFAHPNEAVIALTYGGILGPVTFNVRQGSYANTQGEIGQVTASVQGVPGASPTKRVVFKQDPANPGTTVFVAKNNGTGNLNYLFMVRGNVYTTFDGITFQAEGTSQYSRFFWLRNNTYDLVFNNCTFNGVATTLAGPDNYLVHSEYGNTTGAIKFTGNTFNNGDAHVHLDAGLSGLGSSNSEFNNNMFNNFYTMGVLIRNQQLPIFKKNTLTTNSVNAGLVTGLDVERVNVGGEFVGNKISFMRPGNGFRFASNTNSTGSPTIIHNNMVKVGNGIANQTFALTAQNFVNTNIYFNTFIANTPATTIAAALNLVNAGTATRVVNNIINNLNTGYAYSITSGSPAFESDYNNIRNSTTSNFSGFSGSNVGFYLSAQSAPYYWYSSTGKDYNSYLSFRYSAPTYLAAPYDTYIGDINMYLRGTQTVNNINGGNTNVDIDGTLRRNPPMIGAHELVPVVAFGGTPSDSTCVKTTTILNSGPVVTSMKPYQYALPGGATRVTYQWSSTASRVPVNGTKFQGVTTPILTILNTDEYDEGTYTCVATLQDGAREYNGVDLTQSTYSRRLAINQPVEIQRQPISQVVCKGGDFVLNFTTKRGTTIGYQWFKDGVALTANTVYPFASAIEGVNNYVLTVRNVDYTASGRYVCKIRTTCGASSTDTVTFTSEAIVYVAKGTQIDKEPVSQVVAPGSSAKFEVAAAEATGTFGISPVRYEWSKNGTVITDNFRYSGATSAVLGIRNVIAADAGNYSVKVIGSCGEATSQTFTLTLGTVSINAAATAVNACEGGNGQLAVTATPSVPGLNLEYHWYKGNVRLMDGDKYAGAHTSSLTIKNANASDVGAYKAVAMATNAVDVNASTTINLGLHAATAISAGLSDIAVCEGTKQTLSVTATGGGTLAYAWKKDGKDIAGATSSSYEIASMDATAAGEYSVTVTGACGSTTSTANVRFSTKPVVNVNAPSASIKTGGKLVIGVTASEDGVTTYKWFHNGTEITGPEGTNKEFVKFNVSNSDAGKYYCEVSSSCGMTKSAEIDVLVTPTTSVDEAVIAEGLKLYNNQPNPFANSTAISFELPKPAFVTLSVTDVFGREVAQIASSTFDAGVHTMNFVPSEFGIANGVYYYTLTTSGTSITQKMLYVK